MSSRLLRYCTSNYLTSFKSRFTNVNRHFGYRASIYQHHFRYFSDASVDDSESMKNNIIEHLRKIEHPNQPNTDIVYMGLIKKINVNMNANSKYTISIDLELDRSYRELKKTITNTLNDKMNNIESLRINMAQKPSENTTDNVLKNVKNIIAVASCKGGVGKSSVAVNLAYTLSKMDYSVGIFDADVFGPSLPTMTGATIPSETILTQDPELQLINPIMYEGVKLMSFGYVPQQNKDNISGGAAIMRGPMVSNITQQLLFQTNWSDLDYLIIDFPPGTSDIHLTLTQKLNIDASIVVTIPNKLSLIDVIKGIEMFNKVNVPTVALIQNMSYYICKDCDKKQNLFGNIAAVDSIDKIRNEFKINNIYELPVYPLMAQFSDFGDPIVLNNDQYINDIFNDIANGVIDELNKLNEDKMNKNNKWEIDNDNKNVQFMINDKEFVFSFIDLRFLCQCAYCVDEMTNTQILKKSDIQSNIEINKIEWCGNYGVRVHWSSKHDSIYTFEQLMSNL